MKTRTEHALDKIVAGQPAFRSKVAAMRQSLAEMFAEQGDEEGAARNLAAVRRLTA